MSTIPSTHIDDAHKLRADGIVELFQLSPTQGGTLYFKPGATGTWLLNEYLGIPCGISEMKKSAERASTQPRLTIGQEDVDLSVFKPLINDGYVDGATLVYMRVLMAHFTANQDIKEMQTFRVKRVESYSRTKISLALSTASESMHFTIPHQQYFPPAFPAVMI